MAAHAPGIRPGLWLKYYRTLADLERARRAAMGPVRDIKRQISAVKRAAAADGANLFAMTLLDAAARQDEAAAQQGFADLTHYAGWAGLPIGTQGQLFSQPDDDEVREHDRWVAEADSREAAAAASQPHYMPALEVSVAAPRKQGRPKGSKNKPKAAAVVRRLRHAAASPPPSFGF